MTTVKRVRKWRGDTVVEEASVVHCMSPLSSLLSPSSTLSLSSSTGAKLVSTHDITYTEGFGTSLD